LGKGAPAVSAEVVPFAEHDGDPLSFHFYRAVAQSAAPCVIVLHTGGWNGGSWDEFQAFNSHLARRGYAVAVVDYRLAPRWQWPAQRDDVLDAVRVLRERAAEFGVDPTRFVLLGRSAGGQIAEAVGYGSEFTGLRGVIAFYAPADMFLAFEYARSDDILNSLKLLRDYLGGDPAERAEVYRNASGIGLVNSASPPTLLLHGRRDELVWFRQSERLAARLTAAGVPNSLIALDWATHAFDYNPHGPGGQLSTRAVDHFLDSVTARSQRFP
jgi:acetyl esterase/lipase